MSDELPAGWRAIAEPASMRSDMTAMLEDGRILRVVEPHAGEVATSWIYDAATDRWTPTGPQLFANIRDRSLAVTAEGWVLASGGMQNERPTASCELFDPKSLAWHAMPPLPSPAYMHATASVRGRVFVFGGGSRSAWSWAPGEGEWTKLPDLPTNYVAWANACVLDDERIVVWEHYNAWVWDHAAWKRIDPVRVRAAVVAAPGGFVMIGGRDSYDEAVKGVATWTGGSFVNRAALPDERQNARAIRLRDGRIAVIGGTYTRVRYHDDALDGGELDIEYRSAVRREIIEVPAREVFLESGETWQTIAAPELWGRQVHVLPDGRVIVLDTSRSVIWTPPP